VDFLTYVVEHERAILEEVKALCRIPSVLDRFDPESETPFGEGIAKALSHMLKQAKADGFVTKNVRNYAGHIEYGEGEELIGILCHLDVVPAHTEGWSTPPFHPVVKDGKLYGRGTMDDKGPLIAAYFALKFLKDLGVKFHRRVRLIMGTDEETAWRGIKEYFKMEEMPTFGFSPDATFPLIHGEKGLFNFELKGKYANDELLSFKSGERFNMVPDTAECTLSIDLKKEFTAFLKYNGYKGKIEGNTYKVFGKNAHAMSPHLGVNAAFILASFLHEHIDNPFIRLIRERFAFDPYGEKLNIAHKDEEMKSFTVNPGVFRYAPEGGSVVVNCRYPKGFNLRSSALKIKNAAQKYGYTYERTFHLPIHYVSKEDPLVTSLMDAYQKITNDFESEPHTIGGGTFARALDKGVAFGMLMPGRKDSTHQIDEHVYVKDLIEATAIYMEAIYTLTREETKIPVEKA